MGSREVAVLCLGTLDNVKKRRKPGLYIEMESGRHVEEIGEAPGLRPGLRQPSV